MSHLLLLLISKLEIVLATIILSLMITAYKIHNTKGYKYSKLFVALVDQAVSNIIVVLLLLIIEYLGIQIHPLVYLIMILTSDGLIRFYLKHQDDIIRGIVDYWIKDHNIHEK